MRAHSNKVGRLWFSLGVDAWEYPGGLLRLDPALAYVEPPSSWPLPRVEVLTPAPGTPASSLGCSVYSLHHEASSPSIFMKVFFFFFLLMKYEIWLESFSCCLFLAGQIFSAMCGWSFTICLLLKTLFLCLPQVLDSNQAYPLDYFLLVIHDDMANGDWKRYPPPKKKLEWENQGFWGLRIRMPDIIVSASSLCHRRWPYSVIYMKREHCWVFQVQ